MAWQRIRVYIGQITFAYYSDMPVEINDIVVVETKHGPVKGRVAAIEATIECNPFKPNGYGYKAKRHILENATKKIYDKESVIMFGCKTVEVKHISSDRKSIFYTDLVLHNGDIVVYESTPVEAGTGKRSLHVGIVVNEDPAVVTANSYIVDVVDMTRHNERKARIKEANKLRAKLEDKKKQFQDLELLRLIAANDPETKEMLDAYLTLTNGPQEVR